MSLDGKDDISDVLQVTHVGDGPIDGDIDVGVATVEAAEKVYGKYSKWFLFIGSVSLL